MGHNYKFKSKKYAQPKTTEVETYRHMWCIHKSNSSNATTAANGSPTSTRISIFVNVRVYDPGRILLWPHIICSFSHHSSSPPGMFFGKNSIQEWSQLLPDVERNVKYQIFEPM